MIDAWWPALYTTSSRHREMGTISFHANLSHGLESQDAAQFFLLKVFCQHSSSGYSTEVNQLWASDGSLIAQAQQMLVLIR